MESRKRKRTQSHKSGISSKLQAWMINICQPEDVVMLQNRRIHSDLHSPPHLTLTFPWSYEWVEFEGPEKLHKRITENSIKTWNSMRHWIPNSIWEPNPTQLPKGLWKRWEGYDDVPRSQTQPVGEEAFIESHEPLRAPRLWEREKFTAKLKITSFASKTALEKTTAGLLNVQILDNIKQQIQTETTIKGNFLLFYWQVIDNILGFLWLNIANIISFM